MAKRKDPTVQVRMYADMDQDIRSIAAAFGVSPPDYMRERFWPLVREDLAKAAEKMVERSRANGKKRHRKPPPPPVDPE